MRDDDLEGASDVVWELPPDLVAFIEATPGMDIDSSSVSDVKGSELEELKEALESKMQGLVDSNTTLSEMVGKKLKEISQFQSDLEKANLKIAELSNKNAELAAKKSKGGSCCLM
mmetsp:Transcript_5180/g.12463  ORF Transcript_5180/g.12463 Transcript_5180/m.12463 type:complete len:115 (-) Transcript_5180:44-388(-)|eukprot:863971-Amphidinium_carterae.1